MTKPFGSAVGVSDDRTTSQPLQVVPAPNPSAGSVALNFHLPETEVVDIGVYDVTGRLVRRLLHSVEPQGPGRLIWDGRDSKGQPVSAGIYLARISTASEIRVARIVMTR